MFDTILSLINENMTDKEIHEIINSDNNQSKYRTDILELSKRIKDGESVESISKEIFHNSSCENFNIYVQKDLEKLVEPFFDTKFIRDWNFEKQCETFDYFFENAIIRVSSKDKMQERSGLKEYELNTIMKVLYTIQKRIIITRFTKDFFISHFYEMFRFDQELLEYIWTLFDDRRNEIMMYIITNSYEISKDTYETTLRLYNIFVDLLEDDE